MKTLGLLWNSSKDIQYQVNLIENKETTKRILSQIAKIYHPLGLVRPVLL